MYTMIFAGWIIGMAGYIVLNRLSKYNNKNYYDVKDFERKFKKVRDEVNGVQKQTFK